MKQLKGTVVSTKMDKSVVVLVETKWQHPMYQKTINRSKKYLVHDPFGVSQGDQVTIIPTCPISKKKRFTITKNK